MKLSFINGEYGSRPVDRPYIMGTTLNSLYILEQFHFHWAENGNEGSEHAIDGKKYSGEVMQ